MEVLELMRQRHSVRKYLAKSIEMDKRDILNELAKKCNEESGLNIQIFYDEPDCFKSRLATYGMFKNVTNYICMVGNNDEKLLEKAGYYGEQLVLKAQEIGLNTCWVALTHGKSKVVLKENEKEAIIIALGYGENQGIPHKNKALNKLNLVMGEAPEWYKIGMEAVLLAPTAVNQQKFKFIYENDTVKAIQTGGVYGEVDLGIVKYHFEVASGHKVQ